MLSSKETVTPKINKRKSEIFSSFSSLLLIRTRSKMRLHSSNLSKIHFSPQSRYFQKQIIKNPCPLSKTAKKPDAFSLKQLLHPNNSAKNASQKETPNTTQPKTKTSKKFYKRLLNMRKTVAVNEEPEKDKEIQANNSNRRKMSVTLNYFSKTKKINFQIKRISKSKTPTKLASDEKKLIKSAALYLPQPKIRAKPQKKEIKYTYVVLTSNNGKIVEKCMQTRTRWEPVEITEANNANFFWSALAYKINFSRNEFNHQYVNHIEKHSELSNKMKLFCNLIRYCEFNKIDLFSFYPLTVVVQLFHSTFTEQMNGFLRLYADIPRLIIGSKDRLQKFYISYVTVNLSKRIGTEQMIKLPETSYAGRNMWLIKPINLNRGRCIKILSNIEEIEKEVSNIKSSKIFTNENHKKISNADYVLLQKYIEKPLLYYNRKFDIRMWVLFTDTDDFYVCKEGHLKATCDIYDLSSDDPYIHLTNYSVQKHNSNFSKIEVGNEISFESFQNELDKRETKINFRKDIYPKICNIIKITEGAVRSKFISYGNKNSFEIFGYDFLIDSKYMPYLIEVNTNPGFEESSPLIKMIIPRMIDDALRLTIDVAFSRDKENDKYFDVSPFEVTGYSNKENIWQKLNK